MTTHQPLTRQSGIYMASAEGGPARRIVGGNLLTGLAFSPDGSQLAYAADGQIWIVPTEGGPSRAVGPKFFLVSDVAWSPSGRFLAYEAGADGQAEARLHILDLATGEDNDLDFTGTFSGMSMAWQPGDHNVLAYFSHDGLTVYDLAHRNRLIVGPSSMPVIWSPEGDALAFVNAYGVARYRLIDSTEIMKGGIVRTITQNNPTSDLVWAGDQLWISNTDNVQQVGIDGSNKHVVVSGLIQRMRAGALRPDALFVEVSPDLSHYAERRIELLNLTNGARRVVTEAPAGHAIQDFEVSSQGDQVAVVVADNREI